MSTYRFVLAASLSLILAGCDDGGDGDAGVDAGSTADAGAPDAGPPVAFELTSSAFTEGGMIPLTHECAAPLVPTGPGDNATPPLTWTAGPAETMSYAVVARDLDASNLVHWVIYDIPATTLALRAAIPLGYDVADPMGAKQAELQSSGFFGYLGMCSDGRINTYRFTVHAMPTATLPGVDMTTTENDAAAAVESMSIASASLSGES